MGYCRYLPPHPDDQQLARDIASGLPGWPACAIARWVISLSGAQRRTVLELPQAPDDAAALLEFVEASDATARDLRGASRVWCESLLLQGWAAYRPKKPWAEIRRMTTLVDRLHEQVCDTQIRETRDGVS